MNTQTREALKMAIEYIDKLKTTGQTNWLEINVIQNACKEALEQPLTRDWKETIDERIAKDDKFKEALAQPAQEQAKADFDVMTYGQSFMLDGKHIPLSDVYTQPTQEPVLLNVKTHDDKTYKVKVSFNVVGNVVYGKSWK